MPGVKESIDPVTVVGIQQPDNVMAGLMTLKSQQMLCERGKGIVESFDRQKNTLEKLVRE